MKNSSVDKEKKKEEIIMSSWLQDSAFGERREEGDHVQPHPLHAIMNRRRREEKEGPDEKLSITESAKIEREKKRKKNHQKNGRTGIRTRSPQYVILRLTHSATVSKL